MIYVAEDLGYLKAAKATECREQLRSVSHGIAFEETALITLSTSTSVSPFTELL